MNVKRSGDSKFLALSGGVGGAKLALGLSRILPPERLAVVANNGDDFDHLGLRICPDLDTVMYTLAGLSDQDRGWGLAGETWQALDMVERLGGPAWFQLGDLDLGTHLMRRTLLDQGLGLSEVTKRLAECLGVKHRLFPMTNARVETQVRLLSGEYLSFQEYFVRDRCEPVVTGFRFDGIDTAELSPGFAQWLGDEALAAVLICPSNPFVSVDPVLGVGDVRHRLKNLRIPVVAVSPIVGGEALKGPAAKMMAELDMPKSAVSVAHHYAGLVDHLVIDRVDEDLAPSIEALGMTVSVTGTVMRSLDDRIELAEHVLDAAETLAGR